MEGIILGHAWQEFILFFTHPPAHPPVRPNSFIHSSNLPARLYQCKCQILCSTAGMERKKCPFHKCLKLNSRRCLAAWEEDWVPKKRNLQGLGEAWGAFPRGLGHFLGMHWWHHCLTRSFSEARGPSAWSLAWGCSPSSQGKAWYKSKCLSTG